MGLVGLCLRLHGTFAHILHAQRAGNHQHFIECLPFVRSQHHAPHPRVQRQFGQGTTHIGQLQRIVNRAQFGQQLVAIGNSPTRRRFQKRKRLHIAQMQRLHAQDHRRQRRTQNLGVGKARPAIEIGLVVQANANAIGHAAATACALVSCGLAHRLNQQLLHLAAQAVSLHASGARIHYIADARHRERGLGHVGGQHNAALPFGVKNQILLGLAQARIQRQHLGIAQRGLVAQVLAQVISRFADFALAR